MLLGSDNEERHQESCNMYLIKHLHCTYDHRLKNIGHPVRSAIHKLQIGRLVVGWVTTSEYLLLYVFLFFYLVFSFSPGTPSLRLKGLSLSCWKGKWVHSVTGRKGNDLFCS
jgi:hypothetical protein